MIVFWRVGTRTALPSAVKNTTRKITAEAAVVKEVTASNATFASYASQ